MSDKQALDNIGAFLEALEELWGRDCEFVQVAREPPLHLVVHRDVPEHGLVVAVTHGVSLLAPPLGAPHRELVLQVESRDPAWPRALGEAALRFRGRSVFSHGELLDLGGPLVPGSALSGFFVFRPQELGEDAAAIALPRGEVELVQLYPLHPGELERARHEGIAWIMGDKGWDPSSVSRRDLSRPR